MILKRRKTTLGEKAVPVTFLNTCPTWTSQICVNGLVSQLLHIRIQCWIIGNITTVNLLLRSITVHTYRCEIPSADRRQGKPVQKNRGPAVRKEARGPTVLQVCVNKCPTRCNYRQLISVINQLDAQNFCFTISLFHPSTCFEHMCSSSGGQNCITQPLVSSHL